MCSLVIFLGVWRCNQELQGRDGPVGPLSAVAFSSANVASGVPDDPNSRPATSGGRVGKGRGGWLVVGGKGLYITPSYLGINILQSLFKPISISWNVIPIPSMYGIGVHLHEWLFF